MTEANVTLMTLDPGQRNEILASIRKHILKGSFHSGRVDYSEWPGGLTNAHLPCSA